MGPSPRAANKMGGEPNKKGDLPSQIRGIALRWAANRIRGEPSEKVPPYLVALPQAVGGYTTNSSFCWRAAFRNNYVVLKLRGHFRTGDVLVWEPEGPSRHATKAICMVGGLVGGGLILVCVVPPLLFFRAFFFCATQY